MPSFASAGWRSAVILSLYGYQGLVAGFAMTALPNWQAANGATLAEIGFYLAVIGVPWTAQPFWGPVVDRFGAFRGGPRRFWVLLGLVGALGCLGLLVLGGEMPLGRLALVLLAHNLFASLVDTAADGMIIDRVPADRLGQATALTRTGFACGTAIGATLFSWAIPAIGLRGAAALMLALGLLAVILPFAVRETPERHGQKLRTGGGIALPEMLASLLRELASRRTLRLIGFCLAVEFVVGAFGVRLSVAMVQEGGWQADEVSRLQGALALLGGTVGALGVALWVDRAGPFRTLIALLLVCAASHLGAGALLLPTEPHPLAPAAALSLSALSPALFFVALAPAVMLESRGATAATRFALYMAALNLGTIAGAAAAASIGAVLDLPWMGIAAGAILIGCAVAAWRGAVPDRG